MECLNCHAMNPAGSKFCFQCGQKLQASEAAVPPVRRPEAPPAETPRPATSDSEAARMEARRRQDARREWPNVQAPQTPQQLRGIPPAQPSYAARQSPPAELARAALAASPVEPRRRRVPGVVWFLAGILVVAVAIVALWLLDLLQLGPPPQPVEVTRFLEVTPPPTRESRPRGGDTPAPIVVETMVVTPEVEVPRQIVVTAVPESTLAPGPAQATLPTEAPPAEGAYVERAYVGQFAGTTVTVMGRLFGEDDTALDESLADFQRRSDIEIRFEATEQSLLEILRVRIAAGDAPDLAILPSALMGELGNLVTARAVVDIGSFLDEDRLLAGYYPTWLDVATLQGPDGPVLAGLWSRAAPRGLVYYALDDFQANGYQVPGTWAELRGLSDQMVVDGNTPWCIGIENGSATGWVAHWWLEEMMLRTASLGEYDLWSEGELPFDSPQVKQAAEALAEIWFADGYAYGGPEAILSTSWMDTPALLFDEPAACLMIYMGPWITAFFPEDAAFGENYGFFPLAPLDPGQGQPLLVEGDVWVMFNDRPEVRAVTAYIGRGESLKSWIEADTAIVSPHLDSKLDWYSDAEQRQMAEILRSSSAVRVPAIDLIFAESADYTVLWAQLAAWVGGDVELDAALAAIEASRP